MRTFTPPVAALLVSIACSNAYAAVTCVLSKDSQQFVRSAAKQSRDADKPNPCDPDAARQTLEGVQKAINDSGSKLVNASVLVNTDKLPLPNPAKVDPLYRPVSKVVETPAELMLPSAPIKPARPDVLTKRAWVLKTSHHTLEEAIEDFAAQVDYEVVYEAREFPLELKRDITIARDADFWEAMRVLGETYRKSDGAFQILPTKFKQIVIVPMGQDNNTLPR